MASPYKRTSYPSFKSGSERIGNWGEVFRDLNNPEIAPKEGSSGKLDSSRHSLAPPEKNIAEIWGFTAPLSKTHTISQDNPLVVRWSLLILLLVIYTTISTPYMIAIDDGSNDVDALFVFDRILDALFISDVLLQFFLSYEDSISMIEVKDPILIAKNYLRFWFWLDLVSIFPYDLIAFFVHGDAIGDLSVLSIIRMFRMFKLFKLMSIKRIFQRMEAQYAINYDYLELGKYLVAVFFIVHLLACGLMIVGNPDNTSHSWMIEGGYDDADHSSQYLTAAYWATMTLSTIGYGDITLVSNAEKGYAVFAMLLGASIYAYVVGGICGIIMHLNREQEEYKANLSLLNSFMTGISLPRNKQCMVRDFYSRTHEFRKTDNQKNALELLSPQLQAVVGVHMHGSYIMAVPFFRKLTGIMIATLSLHLQPQSYSPRETLVERGEPIKQMLILKKGTVMEQLMFMTVPYYFGKEIILTDPGRAHVSIIALKYCDTYALSQEALNKLKEKYPLANKHIHRAAIKLAFNRTTLKIARQIKEGVIKGVLDYDPRSNFRRHSVSMESILPVVGTGRNDNALFHNIYLHRMDEMQHQIDKIEAQMAKVLRILEGRQPSPKSICKIKKSAKLV